jgi:hypothetical protein
MSDTISNQTSGYKLFRKWEWKGFGFRSDLISSDYMRRWVLKTPWFLLRLHKIMRSDNDRHHHDHPFDFTSFILYGGYVEYRPDHEPREYLAGDIVRRKAPQLHYLKLREDVAWTFLVTSPYYREWGFQTEDGWIVASKYDAWLEKKEEHNATR